MRLHILGMNGPYPAPGSACSGYLAETGAGLLAMDLGCGTLPALTALCPPEDLTALLLSHWHGDHCSDLLALLYRLESVRAQRGDAFQPLRIFAPEDASSPVRAAVKGCGAVRLTDVAPGDTLAFGPVEATVFAARHPVPAVMYRVREAGRTLCYTGDTNTVEGLADFAAGASLLLADGLFPKDAWAACKPHLSAEKCAELAREAGAEQLVVTHLNPAFDPETLLREARAVYPGAVLARCGMTLNV